MTDRVDLLEERVAALATAVAALETRLAGLERGTESGPRVREEREASDAAGAAAEAGVAAPPRASGAAPMALAGRAFLGIGGAYLFRALTEAGTLPHLAGVALGLVYAGAWILAAEHSGRAGQRAEATLHAFLSLAVDEIHLEMASREYAELEIIGAIAKVRDVSVGIIDVMGSVLFQLVSFANLHIRSV